MGSEFDSDAEDPKGGTNCRLFVEVGGCLHVLLFRLWFQPFLLSPPKIWEMIQFDFCNFFSIGWRETTN